MKQEASFLQWASIMLDVQVSSLSSIQDVRFVKNLLWHVEQTYFTNWQNGRGNDSYSQVLEIIAKYFCQEIGTDITQQIEGINVYKNVIEVWQLVFCIAIKGSRRETNINIIFQMDYALQADLVTIVTEIINKFGNAATGQQEKQQVEAPEEKNMDGKERQMMIEFAEENEDLKEKIKELQFQLKQQKKNGAAQRQELEHSLQMLRLQKMAFFQIIANANRSSSSSKIFEEGDDPLVNSQVSLSQLAKDIVIFIRDQRKRLVQELQKTSSLQQQLHISQRDIRRCVDENELYLMQLGNLSAYEKQLEILRLQKNQVFQENSLLLERITTLEEEKFQLIANFQKRIQNMEEDSQSEANQEVPNIRQISNKVSRKQSKVNKEISVRREQIRKSQSSSDSNEIKISVNDVSREESVREKGTCLGKEMDQLRQPQLRNKLQREIIYLKTTISGLQRQNESLKKTNQTLQRSTRQFMDSNQVVVKKWEEDYQGLLDKMTELTKFREQLKQKQAETEAIKQNTEANVEIEIIDNQQDSLANDKEQPLDQSKKSKPEEQEKQELKKAQKMIEKDRVALWDEIVNKLKQIIKKGKAKQLSYENSLNHLRQQNFKLLEIIRNKNKEQDMSSSRVEKYEPSLSQKIEQLNKSKSISEQEYLVVGQQKSMASSRPVQKMAFLSILEADDQESSFSKQKDKSAFFELNSVILDGIHQKKPQTNSFINNNEEYYLNLNRRLTYSIKQTLDGLGRVGEPDIMGSIDLQQKLQKQINKIQFQYQRLNENYQSVFTKLNIYTEQLKQKESLKKEYVQMLAQLTKAEEEVKIGHQSEIIRLRLINDNLHQHLIETTTEKEEILQVIKQLGASMMKGQANRQGNWQRVFEQVEHTLKQAQMKYSQSLKDPLNFLDVCLSGSKEEGNLQKFYRLYMKERQKTARLNEELQLLSCVLLEYRTMCS